MTVKALYVPKPMDAARVDSAQKKSPCHFLSLQALYTSTAPFAAVATVHMWLVKFQSITMKNSLP